MTASEFYLPWSAERLRHLLNGPYDYERKFEGRPETPPLVRPRRSKERPREP